jgi:hypothetical protein
MDSERSHVRQMVGSVIVALVIAAIVVAVVTAKIGPGKGDEDHGGKGKHEQTDDSGRGSGED